MKKLIIMFLFFVNGLAISACSVREDAADLYKQESPIKVDIHLPESISTEEEVIIQAVLTQQEKKLEEASFVHFEIWKLDGSVRYPMEEAKEEGNGVYQKVVRFKTEGLYYLEVHAGNNGSVISPQTQFVVGDISERELEALKQGPKQEKGSSSHH